MQKGVDQCWGGIGKGDRVGHLRFGGCRCVAVAPVADPPDGHVVLSKAVDGEHVSVPMPRDAVDGDVAGVDRGAVLSASQ
eukprot:13680511-Heterocapsa_arctica.AAC.1